MKNLLKIISGILISVTLISVTTGCTHYGYGRGYSSGVGVGVGVGSW